MDSDIVGSILLQVVLIAVNAVFACAEINWKKWHRRETKERRSCFI